MYLLDEKPWSQMSGLTGQGVPKEPEPTKRWKVLAQGKQNQSNLRRKKDDSFFHSLPTPLPNIHVTRNEETILKCL